MISMMLAKANEMVKRTIALFMKVRVMGIRRKSYHYFVETPFFFPAMMGNNCSNDDCKIHCSCVL
jgi:hypothetical protein